MKIKDLVTQATQFLKGKSPSARLDAEVIIADELKITRSELYTKSENQIEPISLMNCLKKIERRIEGEPVAYITNKKEFLNFIFHIERGVLIPRPETENLVEYVLHWIEEKSLLSPWVLDLGCGSGNIGISLCKEVYNIHVVEVDSSTKSIEVCNFNAKQLGVQEKITTLHKSVEDLNNQDFEKIKNKGFTGLFDCVVSNPPYIAEDDTEVDINVKKFEPAEALFCGQAGLEKIINWTEAAASFLKPGGLWIFEIGYRQGSEAQDILKKSGHFKEVEVVKDFSNLDRFIISVKKDRQDNLYG